MSKRNSNARSRMASTTTNNNPATRDRATRARRRQVVDLVPMQVQSIPSQLRVKTRASIEVLQDHVQNLYFSAGQINQSPAATTHGVKNFDGKALKFFGIYRYWRCIQVTATIVNTTPSTSNATIYVGWAPGEMGTYSIPDLVDNDVSTSVGAGQGRGTLTIPQAHALPNGMWRRTREQEVVTLGGVTQVFPSIEEVTQGVLGVITTGTSGSTAGIMTVESVWEFKEFL